MHNFLSSRDCHSILTAEKRGRREEIMTKKTYKLNELDCANCAAKIEDGISRIEGVESVTVNYMTQKMVVEVNDQKLKEIVEKAQKVIKKVDPAVRLAEL